MVRKQLPIPEWGTYTGVLKARFSGRSYWSIRYTDGRIVSEWEDDPGSPNKHADWSRLPLKGRQALRLYCPNGQVAHLGDSLDASGRLVQFKVGLRTVGLGHGVLAHVIGIIEGTDGQGRFYAWERQPDGSGVLNGPFQDCAWNMTYHNIGGLSPDHLGLEKP
jgi:hypothetical protein